MNMVKLAVVAGLFVAASANLLAGSKAAEAKKAIADLNAAKDSKAKAAALDDLGRLAQIQKSLVEPAVDDIKKALKDDNVDVRRAAATAYGRCDPDPKVAVPLLTQMLKDDKSEDVKIGVAHGLAAMGPSASDAMPTIREMLKAEREKQDKNKGQQTRLQRELGNTARAIGEMRKK